MALTTQHKKKLTVLLSVLAFLLLVGWSSKESYNEEKIDYFGGIYKSQTRVWDSNRCLIKTVTEYNANNVKTEKPFTEFYKKPTTLVLEGKTYQRYEVDKKKTYTGIATSEWLKRSKSKTYVFAINEKAFFSTLEKKGDGILALISFYEDNGRLSKIFEMLSWAPSFA